MVALKNRTIQQIAPMIQKYAGPEQGQRILKAANACLKQLIEQNRGTSKAVRVHTEKEIFPCISLYEAMQNNGIAKEEALKFLDESWSHRAQKNADSMKKLFKFGHLYKLYPAMFKQVAKKQFGPAAGFEVTFYACGKQHCKFDMKKCLFLDTCRRYGCPELTQCFCHTDDIKNEDLHPYLCWNRTQYMGNGGSFCDFEIYIKTRISKPHYGAHPFSSLYIQCGKTVIIT